MFFVLLLCVVREHGMKDERFMVSIPATPEGLDAMKELRGSVRFNATCVFSQCKPSKQQKLALVL